MFMETVQLCFKVHRKRRENGIANHSRRLQEGEPCEQVPAKGATLVGGVKIFFCKLKE